MGSRFPVRIMHHKGYLRTWYHRYFISAKLRLERNMRSSYTVRLNSKRSWSPTHLSLSSWPSTARRLLQCHTCTWLESPLEACRWRCSLLWLGLEGARTMQRSHEDTLLYLFCGNEIIFLSDYSWRRTLLRLVKWNLWCAFSESIDRQSTGWFVENWGQ